jgi:hypothetical protein
VPKPSVAAQDRAPIGVPLRAAFVATGVEALTLAASAVGLALYQLSGHRPQDVAGSWGVVAMAALGAVGLGLIVRGLIGGRRWARSPAVLTQLIALPVGGSAIGHGGAPIGVLLVLCGLVALVGLFAPSTARRFDDG